MLACTRHTSLKLPAIGKVTVNVCPFTSAGVVTHVEPSKMAGSCENPGHPFWNGGRIWAALRKFGKWTLELQDFAWIVGKQVLTRFIAVCPSTTSEFRKRATDLAVGNFARKHFAAKTMCFPGASPHRLRSALLARCARLARQDS